MHGIRAPFLVLWFFCLAKEPVDSLPTSGLPRSFIVLQQITPLPARAPGPALQEPFPVWQLFLSALSLSSDRVTDRERLRFHGPAPGAVTMMTAVTTMVITKGDSGTKLPLLQPMRHLEKRTSVVHIRKKDAFPTWRPFLCPARPTQSPWRDTGYNPSAQGKTKAILTIEIKNRSAHFFASPVTPCAALLVVGRTCQSPGLPFLGLERHHPHAPFLTFFISLSHSFGSFFCSFVALLRRMVGGGEGGGIQGVTMCSTLNAQVANCSSGLTRSCPSYLSFCAFVCALVL